MARKLASIQQIVSLDPIEDADLILKAQVLNWQLVTGKDNGFKIGDKIIFIEPDAWVPNDIAPFLSKGQEPREYNGVKGERLRTVKLRGQVSQGLILPCELIINGIKTDFSMSDEGANVTEQLGIQKYEPPAPACLVGQIEGPFPSCFPKTDEDRVQTFSPAEWLMRSSLTYEVTEKLEGTSVSIGRIDGKFVVCSRNLNLRETVGNTLWEVARRYDIEAKMITNQLDNLIIQGELIGEGIQKNYYGIKGHDYFVFAIYNTATGEFVSPQDRLALCSLLGLNHVPDVTPSGVSLAGMSVSQVLEMANGTSMINSKKAREGLVFKQVDGQTHWKAVSPKYLLKNES
jgi:RNA ligase (TIGR02306 family)